MGTANVMNLDLGMAANYYLEKCASPGSSTMKAKRRDLILFLAFIADQAGSSPKVRHLTVANLTAFREHRLKHGAATASVCREMSTVKHFGKKLCEYYGLKFELNAVKAPKMVVRAPKELSPEQIALVRNWLASQGGAFRRSQRTLIFELLLATALRAMEVLEPTMEQLDWDESMFKDVKCKGSKYRDPYLPAYVHKHIREYMKHRVRVLRRVFREHGASWDILPMQKQLKYPLFISAHGAIPGQPETFRCSYGVIKSMFMGMSKHLGFRVHAHLLRHTNAHAMMRHTKDIRMAQKTLGHSDIKTTMIYADVHMAEVYAAQEQIQL